VFNINGQKIGNLCDKEFTEGVHEIKWNGTDQKQQQLPAGIYFIRMQANDEVSTSKVAITN
jgi:flagellar hook assembly protein FlgD